MNLGYLINVYYHGSEAQMLYYSNLVLAMEFMDNRDNHRRNGIRSLTFALVLEQREYPKQ